MHMADALLSPAVAGAMYACSAVAAGVSIKKLDFEKEEKTIPVMGVMGAFVFAAQMINFTIPGTGSSGHLCGGMLLSAIVGPYAGFLTMIGVLLIQCLLFADGGLLALGANVWNMAFYGCFIGGGLLWHLFTRKGLSKGRITAASIVGCVLTLQLGAFSVSLETLASGITALPFKAFLLAMQPIHLAIGLVEGLITAAVLVFIYQARPELLQHSGGLEPTARKEMPLRKLLLIFVVLALAVAGIASLFASALPDGLEWSIARLTGDTELAGSATGIYQIAAWIQEKLARFPDYNFANQESNAGTSVSGIVGAAVVMLAVFLAGKGIKQVQAKNKNEQTEQRHS